MPATTETKYNCKIGGTYKTSCIVMVREVFYSLKVVGNTCYKYKKEILTTAE